MRDARRALSVLVVQIPLVAFLLVGGICYAFSVIFEYSWAWALLAGAVGGLIAFGWFVGRVADTFYPKTEQREIKPDNKKADPVYPQNTKVAIMTKTESNYPSGEYASLSVDPKRLHIFAKGVLGGKGISLSEWTGKRGIFSRSEFSVLRSEMIERKLLRWKNENAHAQGVELTRGGESFLRHIASGDPNPIPAPLTQTDRYIP
jgi:hypothetical protein